MIEALAEIAKAAQEISANIEECYISADSIEDIKKILSEITEGKPQTEINVNNSLASESLESIDDIDFDLSAYPELEPRSTYIKDGHSFETDDRGTIFKKDGEYIPNAEFESNGGRYRIDSEGNIETLQEGYQSSYKERLDRTPVTGERGAWNGKPGESRYVPNSETERGAKALSKLSEYQLSGIDYKDAIPDFSKCAEESVEIDMTEYRRSNPLESIVGNFEKADTECAKKWNEECKDGKTDWTHRDIATYRTNNNMTWHECVDKKTCQLISRDIHEFFGHSGGVFECKKSASQIVGGVFDA